MNAIREQSLVRVRGETQIYRVALIDVAFTTHTMQAHLRLPEADIIGMPRLMPIEFLELIPPEPGGSGSRFLVVCGDEISGPYDSYRDALDAGYLRHGLGQFIVRQHPESTHYVSRDLR